MSESKAFKITKGWVRESVTIQNKRQKWDNVQMNESGINNQVELLWGKNP